MKKVELLKIVNEIEMLLNIQPIDVDKIKSLLGKIEDNCIDEWSYYDVKEGKCRSIH